MIEKQDQANRQLLVFELNKEKTFLPVFSNIPNFSKNSLDMQKLIDNVKNQFSSDLKPIFSIKTPFVLPGFNISPEDFIELENLIDQLVLSNEDISKSAVNFAPFLLDLIHEFVSNHSTKHFSINNRISDLKNSNSQSHIDIKKQWEKLVITGRKNPSVPFFISYIETFSAKNDSVKAPSFIKNLISLYREKGNFISYLNKQRFNLSNIKIISRSKELNKAVNIWKKALFQSRYLFLRTNIYRGFIYLILSSICFDFFLNLNLNKETSDILAFNKTIQVMETIILPYPGLFEYLDKLPIAGILLDKFFSKNIAFKTLHNHIWR